MWRLLFFFMMLGVSQISWAEPLEQPKLHISQFEEGRDYFSYQEPLVIPARADHKILIQFFFDYDCRVCSVAQDILNLYSQINRDHIVLTEIPVATTKANLTANIFYTLQQMNAENVSDLLLFESSEKKRYTELAHFPTFLKWLAQQHIDTEEFTKLYHSVNVRLQVKDAIQLTEEYGVFTYPYAIINGRYVLTASTLYNDDYSFAVLDFLINKLLQEKQ
ncbi:MULTISPECIES: thiol:disulfide interchange protein DsbA/DsbL [unclassified Avibacterium]|uniref:thiol:disulfide interchange protein DsbA/DsbL n=1 Tax=unclassified Avibacterium TaxID=2685287 RepID=UPI002026E92A|nr:MULTISPECIES: thiol:disulfide interchange protein DsbA/DsbL [unclassified Avibacterium]MCW9698453.1 thiol:disulfide interchange protein DsbA/DsbL [Avibacterium sp. 20-129]MCW9716954.1 thiol:disulfide interchange protein DsbA/DsbL [Avibacterium sp. 21-599]URL07310.1 thiol:disulfide interchange protein DsbA/DsbL [Avibacterium sp. 21-595]